MTTSFTVSSSETFTLTHARHMGAKVAADLKRLQRLYDEPTDAWIADYEAEAIEYLKAGYLGVVTYGFRRDGNWVEPALRYTALDLAGASANDDDPGRVRPGANIVGARFYSYLERNAKFWAASAAERAEFFKRLPFQRGDGNSPGVSGYFSSDRVYSSGGRALNRSSVRSF